MKADAELGIRRWRITIVTLTWRWLFHFVVRWRHIQRAYHIIKLSWLSWLGKFPVHIRHHSHQSYYFYSRLQLTWLSDAYLDSTAWKTDTAPNTTSPPWRSEVSYTYSNSRNIWGWKKDKGLWSDRYTGMTINPFENSPLSDRFDTTATPAFFSTFPVRRSKYHHALSEILSHTIDNSPLCDGLKRQWETHFDTPLGSDLYSVTWCESPELERLVLWMNALEVSFIYDGTYLLLSFKMLPDSNLDTSLYVLVSIN